MIGAVLTDIEGTTSSLSFVKDVLFPYSRERIGGFVRAHRDDPEVSRLLDEVAALDGLPGSDLDAVVNTLERWIDEDRKITPLKSLQGMIWEAGYREGILQGHLYPDAVAALRRWAAAGVPLYVYSSGSVHAQHLLFGHSVAGDLRPLFRGYFDTTIGPKVESASYQRIASEIGVAPAQVMFLSDMVAELDAARAAGMQTTRLVREGTVPGSDHPEVSDFSAIRLD